jgi:hypothetical protein
MTLLPRTNRPDVAGTCDAGPLGVMCALHHYDFGRAYAEGTTLRVARARCRAEGRPSAKGCEPIGV